MVDHRRYKYMQWGRPTANNAVAVRSSLCPPVTFFGVVLAENNDVIRLRICLIRNYFCPAAQRIGSAGICRHLAWPCLYRPPPEVQSRPERGERRARRYRPDHARTCPCAKTLVAWGPSIFSFGLLKREAAIFSAGWAHVLPSFSRKPAQLSNYVTRAAPGFYLCLARLCPCAKSHFILAV